MLIIEQIKTYRKGLRVERLHTVPHALSYSNGHHSANVALLAHELCLLNGLSSSSVVLAALMHDIHEGELGDLPAPAKRKSLVLRVEYEILENDFNKIELNSYPDLHPQEADILRIADIAELGMHCKDELAMGNTNCEDVLLNVMNYLQDYRKDYKGVDNILVYLAYRG